MLIKLNGCGLELLKKKMHFWESLEVTYGDLQQYIKLLPNLVCVLPSLQHEGCLARSSHLSDGSAAALAITISPFTTSMSTSSTELKLTS